MRQKIIVVSLALLCLTVGSQFISSSQVVGQSKATLVELSPPQFLQKGRFFNFYMLNRAAVYGKVLEAQGEWVWVEQKDGDRAWINLDLVSYIK